jgi:DNA-binding protein H-NS
MKPKLNLDAMSIDEVWQLHEAIVRVLSARLTSEKRQLEKRLAQLHRETGALVQSEPVKQSGKKPAAKARRKYPKVFPKYRNPDNASETWSGRGKKPRWLTAALKAGHSTDEFMISKADANKTGSRTQWARPAAE